MHNSNKKDSRLQYIRMVKKSNWVIITLFVLVQAVLCLCVMMDYIEITAFKIELVTLTAAIMLLLNIGMIVVYC